MVKNDDCVVCSGIQADIKALEKADGELAAENQRQWDAIDALRNRLPVWATITISVLTFICGILMALPFKS